MQEDHEVRIANLMTSLITRLEFEVNKQEPGHLPAITQAIVILDGYRTGSVKLNERHMIEMNLIKKVTNEINRGGQNGRNEGRQPQI